MQLAEQISGWSKDPTSKIGAVTVGNKGQVLAQGYNGFPRGMDDNELYYANRAIKYNRIVHAEMNAIFNASYNGVSLNDSTMYVYGLPTCSNCALGVIQVGVKKVVMPKQDIPERWQDSWNLTKSMFEEAGVEYSFIDYEKSCDSRTKSG
tara:strand:+ start:350 stop:799 length:450 start_codon:yes stop_codon:yes gene_type:complete